MEQGGGGRGERALVGKGGDGGRGVGDLEGRKLRRKGQRSGSSPRRVGHKTSDLSHRFVFGEAPPALRPPPPPFLPLSPPPYPTRHHSLPPKSTLTLLPYALLGLGLQRTVSISTISGPAPYIPNSAPRYPAPSRALKLNLTPRSRPFPIPTQLINSFRLRLGFMFGAKL